MIIHLHLHLVRQFNHTPFLLMKPKVHAHQTTLLHPQYQMFWTQRTPNCTLLVKYFTQPIIFKLIIVIIIYDYYHDNVIHDTALHQNTCPAYQKEWRSHISYKYLADDRVEFWKMNETLPYPTDRSISYLYEIQIFMLTIQTYNSLLSVEHSITQKSIYQLLTLGACAAGLR